MTTYKPLPKAWGAKAKIRLLETPDRHLHDEYPKYSFRQLTRWKAEIRKEREDKHSAYHAGELTQKEIDIWVSKKELTRRKRQEYNEAMGLTHDVLAGKATAQGDAEKVATYLTKLASDEDKFKSQRAARSVSLAAANELLLWQHVEDRLTRVAQNLKARPQGYARRKAQAEPDRVLNCLWTDHHNGAALPGSELPVGYDEHAQRRRFAHVLQNALDYKLDHRHRTGVNIYDAGDNMEGYLGHDPRSGEPLADQFAVTLEYRIQATEHLAAQFPHVNVYVDPGNHDRNKLRHHGRATYQKWDSYQTMLGFAWRAACARLKNVTFHIDKKPYSCPQVLGFCFYVTHGDTHFNLGNPGTSLNTKNLAAQIHSINSSQRYGHKFDVFAAGHVHTSVNAKIAGADLFVNASLCPSSGHADNHGYDTDASQWMWETTDRYAVGDTRRVNVGPEQDKDTSLDLIITPVNHWEQT